MNTVISNSLLDEFVALKVLSKELEIFKNRRIHAKAGFELAKNWVEANNEFITWIAPKAGALCCIKFNEDRFNGDGIDAFHAIVKTAGIQLANGEWFG